MAKKQNETHDVFYIGISDPVDVRRSLLESARETIHFMKRYEKLKSVRTEKIQMLLKLDTEVKELRALLAKLKKMFPSMKMHTTLPIRKPSCIVCGDSFKTQALLAQHMKRHEPKKKEEKKVEIRQELDDAPEPILFGKKSSKRFENADELESELASIERKLEGLA